MQTLGLADSTPKPTSRLKELFWPNLRSEPSALSACDSAAMACFFIAGVTALVAIFTQLSALIDAFIFVCIALGLRKASRTAALCGFILYVLEQAVNAYLGRYPGILSILFTVILFNAVRASFAYHRMRRNAALVSSAAAS